MLYGRNNQSNRHSAGEKVELSGISYTVMEKNKNMNKLKKKKNKNQLVPVSLRVWPPLNNSSAELSSFANSIPF